MEYDKDKADELTLALMYIVMSKERDGGRAWKGFDLQILTRLHQKGWITEPKLREMTLTVTPDGVRKAEEMYRKYLQGD